MSGRLHKILKDQTTASDLETVQTDGTTNPPNLSAAATTASAPPFYTADLCGNFISVNAAYRRLAASMVNAMPVDHQAGNDTMPEPVFPLDEVIANVIAMAAGTTRTENLETTDGLRSFSSNHFPIHNDSGLIVAVGGMYTDVSDKDTQGLAQLVAQDRFDDIARLVTDLIWETDTDFNLVYVSSRVNEVLEIHPREIMGKNMFDIGTFKPRDGERNQPLLTRETRSPFRDINFLITLADGRTRKLFLSGLPMFSDTGAFKGFRGTATEISAETAARRNASISRDRLTAAIENISEGFALFDAEDRLILFNNRFKEYLAGIARFLVPGAAFSGVLEAAVNSGFVTGPENALLEWNVLHTEATEQIAANIELHLASGRWIRISDRSTEDGGVVTIVSDVTDMKNREEALRSSKELAEQGSRAKSEFLANMSHELRTPLNAIIGFTEVMRDQALGPIGNERYQEYIHDILDSGRHLLGVINDILDVSKADAGKLELHEEKVSLKREADATIRLFCDQAEAAEVAISSNLPNDLPPFYSDQRKIRQIFLNLVSNAVKFTPAGGTVRIDGGLNKEGGVTIQIIDTGIGIKKEDIPAALSAFGQVDSSLARRFDGTGLGLPLTVALIKLHDGDLKLESTPGEGTCISIAFPANRVLSGPRA